MAAAEQEMRQAHAAYLEAWNRALRTGGSWEPVIAYLGPRLQTWFRGRGMAGPSTGDAAAYADSIRDAIGYLGREGRWTCTGALTVMRSPAEGMLAARYELPSL